MEPSGHMDVAETWMGTWDGFRIQGLPAEVSANVEGLIKPHLSHLQKGSQVVVTFLVEAISGQA